MRTFLILCARKNHFYSNKNNDRFGARNGRFVGNLLETPFRAKCNAYIPLIFDQDPSIDMKPGETLIPGGRGKRFTLVSDMPHIYPSRGKTLLQFFVIGFMKVLILRLQPYVSLKLAIASVY